jgi:hypothetical protein
MAHGEEEEFSPETNRRGSREIAPPFLTGLRSGHVNEGELIMSGGRSSATPDQIGLLKMESTIHSEAV